MKQYKIPGSQDMTINESLRIFDADGNIVASKVTDNDRVDIVLLGHPVKRSREWLFFVACTNYLDEFDLEHLKVISRPASRSKIPYVGVYDVPKYCDPDNRIRVVAGYPAVGVSRDGHVYSVSDLKEFPYKVVHGYRHIYCKIEKYNKELFLPVYKLVALAWIPNSDYYDKYVVNHIDGNKLNDSCENLEWVTYAGNTHHAVEHGLFLSARKGRIRDITTGEIIEFPSLERMNAFLGLRAKEINHFLTRRCNQVYGGKYEVRIEGDDRPWVYTDSAKNVMPSRYIITVRELFADEKVFNGVMALINHYKLWNMGTTSCSAAVERLKAEHPNYDIFVEDQYDTRPIEVKNLTTGLVETYSSVKDLVANTGLCKTTCLTAIKHDGRKIVEPNLVMRRKTNKPWPSDIRIVRNRPVGIQITDKVTQMTATYKSLRDAERELGRVRSFIQRCMMRPKESDRYVIKAVELPHCREIGIEQESELLRTPKALTPEMERK